MTTTFDNLPDPMLADEIGDLDANVKALQARLKGAKEEFFSRGLDKVCGERFTATKSETVRWSLDTKAVKAEMGENWYDRHCRQTHVVALRVTVNKEALASIAA